MREVKTWMKTSKNTMDRYTVHARNAVATIRSSMKTARHISKHLLSKPFSMESLRVKVSQIPKKGNVKK
jgi:hypothetical protein